MKKEGRPWTNRTSTNTNNETVDFNLSVTDSGTRKINDSSIPSKLVSDNQTINQTMNSEQFVNSIS